MSHYILWKVTTENLSFLYHAEDIKDLQRGQITLVAVVRSDSEVDGGRDVWLVRCEETGVLRAGLVGAVLVI